MPTSNYSTYVYNTSTSNTYTSAFSRYPVRSTITTNSHTIDCSGFSNWAATDWVRHVVTVDDGSKKEAELQEAFDEVFDGQ